MLPYNVEIFSRSLAYKSNFLIDGDDFSWKEDAVDPEKNDINAPTSIEAAKGDFVRIIRNGEEYQGVVTAFERGDVQNTLTISQLVTVFDLEVAVAPDSAMNVTIEPYIFTLLTSMFINSGDSAQNVPNLVLSTVSSNTGTIFSSTSTESAIVVSLLDDIIYPSFEKYAILTGVRLAFNPLKVNAVIGADTTAPANVKKIEADLPNVFESNFTIRKTDREINKAVIKDSTSSASATYYLHPDGTYNTTNSNRIIPVVNAYEVYNGTKIRQDAYNKAKSNYDAELAAMLVTFNTLEASRSLTVAQLSELERIGSWLYGWWHGGQDYTQIENLQKSCKKKTSWGQPAQGTNFVFREADPRIIDSAAGPWPGPGEYEVNEVIWNCTDYHDWSESFTAFDNRNGNYPSYESSHDANWNFMLYTNDDSGNWGNVYMKQTFEQKYWYNRFDGYHQEFEYHVNYVNVLVRFTQSMAQAGMNRYKSSSQYTSDVASRAASAQSTAIADTIANLAKSVFAKNKYSNLIELTVKVDDPMIKPMELDMGQKVDVLHDGVSYSTILTGREVDGGKVKLIFGTIRLELTKYLKGRY